MAKTATIIFCLIFLLIGSFVQAQDVGPWIGSIRADGTYQVRFDFGIEQWEEGKLTTHRRQQWLLRCSYPDPFGDASSTSCSLDRVVIDKGLRPSDGDMIGKHRHDSSDGTLKFVNVNWSRGILDFTVVHTDRSTIEVLMRFKARGKVLYLDSFKATGIARGMFSDSMTAIDYRIPKYGYVLNVPVEMRGLRTPGDKEWDELLATISKEDRKIWQDLVANPPNDCRDSSTMKDEEVMNKITADDASRKAQIENGSSLTVTEQNRFANLMADGWTKCLAKSKISITSQKKIVELLRRQFTSAAAK